MVSGSRVCLAMLLLFSLLSCKKPVETSPQKALSPPPSKVKANEDPVIAESNDWFESGLEALARGDQSEALADFDMALTLVLDCTDDLNRQPRLKHHFEDLVARIHEAEVHGMAATPNAPAYDEATLSKLLDDSFFDETTPEVLADQQAVVAEDGVPLVHNAVVDLLLERFTTARAEIIGAGLERSTYYLPMIRRIFKEEGLPMELCYLPLIESAYKVKARSRASAVGLWQFVEGTGRLYGLKIDWWEDQRRDPELSTRAAARFLKDLYNRFGDWNLALSAYNAGPGRVERVIRRSGTRDFWKLYQGNLLPKETRTYVPAFIAGVLIARNPEEYGFVNLAYLPERNTETIEVDFAMELDVLAEKLGIDKEQLESDNASMLRGMTPGGRPIRLHLPVGLGEKALQVLAEVPEEQRIRTRQHRVRSGDTLSKIAARYDSTVPAIMATNNLRDARKLTVGQTLLIPRAGMPLSPFQTKEEKSEIKDLTHSVRRGDSLYALAQKYNTSIPSLLALNPEVDPAGLYPGQKLQVRSGDRDQKIAKTPSRSKGFTLYTVKAGDTIFKIARRHGVDTKHLLEYNQLKSNVVIHPGQRLQIPNTDSQHSGVIIYKVRPGDTLAKIANRFKTKIGKLMEWNHLSSKHSISAGQEILIYL